MFWPREPNHCSLLVIIHHEIYPITTEVFRQLVSPYGYLNKISKSRGYSCIRCNLGEKLLLMGIASMMIVAKWRFVLQVRLLVGA